MGLVFSHLSASSHYKDGAGKNAGGISGSLYFAPDDASVAQSAGQASAFHATRGFGGHADAAYIFSGSVGTDASPSTDRTVFLGDVVVSGSLLSGGGNFIDGDLAATEVAFGLNDDTIEGEPSFTYTKGSKLLKIGDSAGDTASVLLANGDLRLTSDKTIVGASAVGIITAQSHKLGLTGALAPAAGAVGAEFGSDAGVILGQGGSPNAGSNGSATHGFIHVRSLTAAADVNDGQYGPGDKGNAAVMVRSDAGGLLLSGSKSTKVHGKAGLVLDSGRDTTLSTVSIKAGASVSSTSVTSTAVSAGTTVDIDGGTSVSINSSGAAINIGNDAVAQPINIGTGASARVITIGEDASTKVDVNALAIELDSAGSTLLDSVTTTDIDAGGALSLNSSGAEINIGDDVVAQPINIGTGAAARTIIVGNAASTKTELRGLAVELDAETTGLRMTSARTDAASATIDALGGISLDGVGASNFSIAGGDLSVIGAGNDATPSRVILSGSSGTDSVLVQSDAQFSADVLVAGSLTVQGDTTTVSTTNLNVEDALIGLQAELTGGNSNDIGFIFERGSSGNNGVFVWDESETRFTLGTTTATAASTGDLTITAGTLAADLEGTSSKVTVNDDSTDIHQPVVFHNESDVLRDDSGAFTYNPATGELKAPKVHVDDIELDGKVIALTGSANDTVTLTAGTDGEFVIRTIDATGAAAHIELRADGNINLDAGAGGLHIRDGGVDKVLFMVDDAGGPFIGAAGGADLQFGTADDDTVIFKIDNNGGVGGAENGSLALQGTRPVTFNGDANFVHYTTGSNALRLQSPRMELAAPTAVAVISDQITFGEAGDTDITLTFNANTKDGQIKWMEDEDYFEFNDEVLLANSEKLHFHDTGNFVHAPDNGKLLIQSDGDNSGALVINAQGAASAGSSMDLQLAGTTFLTLDASDGGMVGLAKSLMPSADNSIDIGHANHRFRNIFTGDLNLRNDRGDWTLIEEEDFISFRNNKTGRRFRMVMEDITGTGTYGPGNDGEM